MSTQMIIFIALKMLFGFSLAFLAILSWAKTRESAWILIIAGSLLRYVELIYSILEELEILSPSWGSIGEISVLNMLITILPLAFLAAGFLMFLIKKTKF